MPTRILRPLSAIVVVVSLAGCASMGAHAAAPLRADSTVIHDDIAYLASDRLEGRLTGTPGNDSAAAYIARRYKLLGLTPLTPDYLQHFDALSADDAHAGRTEPRKTENVVALLRGTDPT